MSMPRSLAAVARAKNIAPEVNAYWENQSFHNYADYAMAGGFRSGLARLRELGAARCCAVMCAEAVWWRCHRPIIADYLLVATSPNCTGSLLTATTMGIDLVAFLAARAEAVLLMAITATCRPTSSAARAGSRSTSPWAKGSGSSAARIISAGPL
jgi:hypothetical protein